MTEIKTWRHSETLEGQFALGSKTVAADDKLRFKFSQNRNRVCTCGNEVRHNFVVNYANYHFVQFYISLVT